MRQNCVGIKKEDLVLMLQVEDVKVVMEMEFIK